MESAKTAQLLWVDDHPENNISERRILTSLGVAVDTARSTSEVLDLLPNTSYDLIFSDLKRDGVEDEGIRFLDQVVTLKHRKPTIFYTGKSDISRGLHPLSFAIATRPDHLLHYIMDVLERGIT